MTVKHMMLVGEVLVLRMLPCEEFGWLLVLVDIGAALADLELCCPNKFRSCYERIHWVITRCVTDYHCGG